MVPILVAPLRVYFRRPILSAIVLQLPSRVNLSVVIPTLNEAATIGRTLEALPPDVEVVVVDGGSSDETCRIALERAAVLQGPRGRARQMNEGARHTKGDVLLFLHADTLVGEPAFNGMREALADPLVEAGAFRLQFDASGWLLRFYGTCTRLTPPSLCFGDRGLFVRRDAFEGVGGFPDLPLFEDVEMVRLLYTRGGFRMLPHHVTTSARRFTNNGVLRQQWRNALLWSRYRCGADPAQLAAAYRYDQRTAR
jgi:rSAM/selenodomain-associated transferase 2